jgi:hypothetical protein
VRAFSPEARKSVPELKSPHLHNLSSASGANTTPRVSTIRPFFWYPPLVDRRIFTCRPRCPPRRSKTTLRHSQRMPRQLIYIYRIYWITQIRRCPPRTYLSILSPTHRPHPRRFVTKTEIPCAEVTKTWGHLHTRGLGQCRAHGTSFPVHACLRCPGGAGWAGCSSTRRLGRLGILRTRGHPAHEVHMKLAKRITSFICSHAQVASISKLM